MVHINWELIGGILGLLTLAFGMFKYQRGNIREFQQMADDIKETKRDVARVDSRVEKVINDRTDIVKSIYEEMAKITKTHVSDIKVIQELITDSVNKTREIETRHHDEVMNEIKALTIQLTDMCSTFKEYRRLRNGDSDKKGKDVNA